MPRKEEKEKGKIFFIYLSYLFLIFLIILNSNTYANDSEKLKFVPRPLYTYSSAGKPDPFEPFIIKESIYKTLSPEELKKLKMLPSVKTELQRIKLSDIKLVAMIKIGDKVMAMIEGPTGKGYIVKKGTGIGTKGGIVEKLIYKDIITPLGQKSIRKMIVKEPFIDKNKKLSFRYIEIDMGKNR